MPALQSNARQCRTSRGFTLIEMLMVIAVLAIITAIAAPNLRALVVRNKLSGISNEFSGALAQSRAYAVAKNSCVTLCVASSGTSTACLGTAAVGDYQTNGWVMFQNNACSATATTGTTLQRRAGQSDGFLLRGSVAGLNAVMFDPRGYANLAAAGSFTVEAAGAADDSYKRKICVDAAGRSTVRSYSSSC